MRYQLLSRILTFSLLSIMFQSCIDDAKKAAMELESADMVQVVQKDVDIADDASSQDPALQSHFVVSYPVFEDVLPDAVADSIERLIATFLSGSEEAISSIPDVQQLAKAFFTERAEVAAEFGNEVPWTMDRRVGVAGKLGNLLSLEFMESSYMGGAHPNSYSIYKVIDLTTGQVVTLYDLLDRSKKPSLDRIRMEQLEKDKKTDSSEEDWKSYFFEESFFPNGNFYKNDNFKLGPDGISFYYNSYEIAAYAFGPTEITIPLKIIQPLVRPESKYLKYF